MEPVELVTSKSFSHEELIASLLQIGVERDENSNRMWDYVLRRGEAIVWIDPDDPEKYPDPEFDTLVESKLGDPPQTYIVLHVSRNPGSEQLALELAIQFAKRWPSVLDNLSGLARRIFTLEEMQALYESDLGLWEDEKTVSLPKEWYTTDEEYLAPWQLEELEKQNSVFEDSQTENSLPASIDASSSPSVSLKGKSPRKRAVPPGEKGNKPTLIKEANTEIMTEADSVQSVLAEMEPVLREVFLLSAASYSPTEITHLLGYEERTVTTYLSQAREQFRQLYHMMSKYR